MYVFLALLPILLALVLMTRFRISPGKALPLSLAMTGGFGYFIWKMSLLQVLGAVLLGVLKSLDIILIIFSAVLLLNVLKKSGALKTVSGTFGHFSPDRRIQAVVIAWIFSNFIEGAAGFGAAPALAAPLLAGLGFPAFPAVMLSLVCNTLPVPFGAVGTPVLTVSSTLAPELDKLGMPKEVFDHEMLSALTNIFGFSGLFLPFLAVSFMIFLSGDKRRFRSILEIFPFCFFAGAVYVIPWKLAAMFFGPELPSILASAAALPLIALVLKWGILTPRHVWEFPENTAGSACPEGAGELLRTGRKENSIPDPMERNASSSFPASSAATAEAQTQSVDGEKMPLWKAWSPYVLIALLLMLTRLPMLPFKEILSNCCMVRLPEFFGMERTSFQWALLNNPGIFPFLAVAVPAAWFYGMRFREMAGVFASSGKQVRLASTAIAASFAMVQIMVFSDVNSAQIPGMLAEIAHAAANSMGDAYLLGAPVIGVLGTFFSGSCTVSNLLFCSIQFHTAHMLHLPEALIVALQNVGGGIGSMIRISGVVAACATVNLSGVEGRLILLNCIPALILILLSLAGAFLFYFIPFAL